MLVLSRKPGEKVVIDGDITATIESALSFAGVADAETPKNQGKIAAPRDGGQQLPGSTGDAAE